MEVLALSALHSVYCVLHGGQTQCVASVSEDRLPREPQAEVREKKRMHMYVCWSVGVFVCVGVWGVCV